MRAQGDPLQTSTYQVEDDTSESLEVTKFAVTCHNSIGNQYAQLDAAVKRRTLPTRPDAGSLKILLHRATHPNAA